MFQTDDQKGNDGNHHVAQDSAEAPFLVAVSNVGDRGVPCSLDLPLPKQQDVLPLLIDTNLNNFSVDDNVRLQQNGDIVPKYITASHSSSQDRTSFSVKTKQAAADVKFQHEVRRELPSSSPQLENDQQQQKVSLIPPPPLTDGEIEHPRTSLLRSRSSIPGAVAVAGFNRDVSSSSIGHGDERSQSSAHASFAAPAATTVGGNHGDIIVAAPPLATPDPLLVAEIVNDDLIRRQITQQVRHELLQQAVQACVLVAELDNEEPVVPLGDAAEKGSSRHPKAIVWWRRAVILTLLSSVIIIGIVVGVILSRKQGNGANAGPNSFLAPTTLSPSFAPTPIPARCGLCYDGLRSFVSDLTLVAVERTNQSCADLATLSMEWNPSDTTCVTSQADAWLYCGCPLLPPRPMSTNCTVCIGGRATGNSGLCPKYDTYVTIVGTEKTCQNLKKSIILEKNCSCLK